MTEQVQHVHRVAQELFEKAPDWVTFFREVLGVNGVIRQQFKTTDEMAEFEQTEAYMQIQHMLAKLRAKNGDRATAARSRPASSPSACRRACTSRCGPRPTIGTPA